MMMLRYGKHDAARPQPMRNAFSTALKVGVLSAGLIFASGAINPVFANKAPLQANPPGYWPGVVEPAHPYLENMWTAKVKCAAAEFKKQHPDSRLIEQDYGVIKEINNSLPVQRQLTAFEWFSYQQCYMADKFNSQSATDATKACTAIGAAVCRTVNNYRQEFDSSKADFEAKFCGKKSPTLAAESSTNRSNHRLHRHDAAQPDSTVLKARHIINAKFKYANVLFKKQHPDSRLIEQDYGVIKQLNNSLPAQRRISVSDWLFLQQYHLDKVVPASDDAITKWFIGPAISAAIERTKNQEYEPVSPAAGDQFLAVGGKVLVGFIVLGVLAMLFGGHANAVAIFRLGLSGAHKPLVRGDGPEGNQPRG